MSDTVLNTDAQLDGKTLLTAEGNWTVSGLLTFSRGAAAPFAVAAASLVVTNLDADKIDGQHLANLAQLNVANTFSAVGPHSFVAAAGGGGNFVAIRNTSGSATDYAGLRAGNDADANLLQIYALSSTYTPSGYRLASGVSVEAGGVGGCSLAAFHASGAIRFYTGGATERFQIKSSGELSWNSDNNRLASSGLYMATWPATGNAANAYVLDGGYVYRSTSSLRYKTDVERLDAARAKSVIAALSPITYRGINDGPSRFAGFAAEEVAEVDPLLVTFDKKGRPDYVTYDRIPAYLVPVVQDLMQRVAALECK